MQTPLVAAVLSSLDKDDAMFSPQALDALRLSEMFESVTAPEYILPLDAMAGFPTQTVVDPKF